MENDKILRDMMNDVDDIASKFTYRFDDATGLEKWSQDVSNVLQTFLKNEGYEHLVVEPKICITEDKKSIISLGVSCDREYINKLEDFLKTKDGE